MKFTIPKRKMQKVGLVLKKIIWKILFWFNYVLCIISDNKGGIVSSLLFSFVAWNTCWSVLKRVGFRHAIDDEEYTFSYSGSNVKHRTL